MRNIIIVLLVLFSSCKKDTNVPIVAPVHSQTWNTGTGTVYMTDSYIIETTKIPQYDTIVYSIEIHEDTIRIHTVPYENRVHRFNLYSNLLLEQGGTFHYSGDTMIIIDWQKTDTIKLF